MEFRRKSRLPADVGLIPMIDVLLVLLFFFMVATTFRHNSNLKINLPQAGGGEMQAQAKAVNLYIDAGGVYALSGENGKNLELPAQTMEGLKTALGQLSAADRQLPLIINADGMTPHRFVVGALDAAGQQGFKQITFAINPPEKK
ncbi:MAG: biopolymer transporter ExbD [Methylococcales bacterium]|nr:biopolymer transporter ExbD [Methylococcales bacterium]